MGLYKIWALLKIGRHSLDSSKPEKLALRECQSQFLEHLNPNKLMSVSPEDSHRVRDRLFLVGSVLLWKYPKKGEHDTTFENKGQLGIISPMEVQNPERSEVEVEAWAPKIIPKSGPAFEALSNQQKNDLRRLHSNLGHPSPEKLCRVLTENGADAQVIAAARDYQCDVCVENKPGPTLPSPSTIHELREFNDCVGCDGVYWKSRAGVIISCILLMRLPCFIWAPRVEGQWKKKKRLRTHGSIGLDRARFSILTRQVSM